MVRFLHIANLQLGKPFTNLTALSKTMHDVVRDSTYDTWQKIVQYALRVQPDFIVLVGNSYDGNAKQLRAQRSLQQGFSLLEANNIQVVMVAGPTDYMLGDWPRLPFGENVHVLPTTVTTMPLHCADETVYITGCSYANATTEIEVEAYLPQNEDVHIALYYGHDAMAIGERGYNYVAAGSRAEAMQLATNVYDSGAPQSTALADVGIKGMYDVTITPATTEASFIPTSSIVVVNAYIDAQSVRFASDILTLCHEHITLLRQQYDTVIATFTLTKLTSVGEQLWHSRSATSWCEEVRTMEGEHSSAIWLATLQADTSSTLPSTHAVQQVVTNLHDWQNDDWQRVLSSAYESGGLVRLTQDTLAQTTLLANAANELLMRKIKE